MTDAREISEERIEEIRARMLKAWLAHPMDRNPPGWTDVQDLLAALDAANKRAAEEAEGMLKDADEHVARLTTEKVQQFARATAAEAEAARLREALQKVKALKDSTADWSDDAIEAIKIAYAALAPAPGVSGDAPSESDECPVCGEPTTIDDSVHRYVCEPPPPADRGEPSEEAVRLVDHIRHARKWLELTEDESHRALRETIIGLLAGLKAHAHLIGDPDIDAAKPTEILSTQVVDVGYAVVGAINDMISSAHENGGIAYKRVLDHHALKIARALDALGGGRR